MYIIHDTSQFDENFEMRERGTREHPKYDLETGVRELSVLDAPRSAHRRVHPIDEIILRHSPEYKRRENVDLSVGAAQSVDDNCVHTNHYERVKQAPPMPDINQQYKLREAHCEA